MPLMLLRWQYVMQINLTYDGVVKTLHPKSALICVVVANFTIITTYPSTPK